MEGRGGRDKKRLSTGFFDLGDLAKEGILVEETELRMAPGKSTMMPTLQPSMQDVRPLRSGTHVPLSPPRT